MNITASGLQVLTIVLQLEGKQQKQKNANFKNY